MSARVERVAVLALCLAIGWFYVWTVRSSGEEWDFGGEKRDYYNLLIDGYLAGQLAMKVDVPEALLNLRNPYDPQERPPGLGLHDASFYQGKYYVYFGAAPMVILMLPFRLLTGMDLPLPVAVLVFVYAGFLASVWLWLAVRHRYFSETTTVAAVIGVLVLGLAGVSPVLLRRPDMWELPIAGGCLFAMLTLAFVWRSLHSERNRLGWFTGAGLSLGLAIASRPTYLVAAPLLLSPLLWWWWWQDRSLPLRAAMRAAVPLAIVGVLMAWHNYARFEHPLEFGQTYQFSLDYESKLPHFRAAYVPFTAKAHFFSAAQWSSSFPFIQRADLGEAPAGFTRHRGDVYGILTNFPVAWLAFLAPLALWRRPVSERGPFAAWLASVVLLFLLTAGVLLFFFSALARYQMDFAPAFMLLACVGLLGLERWLQHSARKPWRLLAQAGCVIAALSSVLFGVLYSLQFDGLLREHNRPLERILAGRFNGIAAVIERVIGVTYGALELTVRLPVERPPGRESLFTSGNAALMDRVIVRYLEDGKLQFGIIRHGSPEQLSVPLSLDPTASHRIAVSMSSLYPPLSHPFFARRTAEDAQRIKRQLRIELNGEPVLVGYDRSVPLDAGELSFGVDAADASHPPFHGTLLNMRRVENFAVPKTTGPFVRLRVAFAGISANACEPLIGFGEVGSAALLTVKYVAEGKVNFGFLQMQEEPVESSAVAIEAGKSHELTLRFEGTREPGRRRILLWRDAELVWSQEIHWNRSDSLPIVGGKNQGVDARCAPEFGGTIFSIQHGTEGRDPLEHPGDVRMRVRLPSDQTGQREPLVVTGRSGSGDMLVVEYVDRQTVRFGLDHWGSPMIWSERLTIDFGRAHTLDISMASLHTGGGATSTRDAPAGNVVVAVDGRRVWQHPAVFHAAEAADVMIGRNRIGGTSCGPVFNGEILSAERVPRE